MGDSLFAAPLVPVANVEDAEATCRAVLPRVAGADGRVVFVHVIEKAGGAPDKASLEQREGIAAGLFEIVTERAANAGVDVETDLRYGTNVAEAIIEAAADADASAIVFTPRGGKAWWDLFSGGVRDSLVTDSDRPVVILPDGAHD
ncbi:MAG: universal stress protein [Halobacteriota archaeon]